MEELQNQDQERPISGNPVNLSKQNKTHSPMWPIILIAIGIIFLLKNFDLVSARVLSNTAKLWPLLLVYLGLDYWTRSNPRLRTIVTILFISGVVFVILLLSDQSAAFWR